MNVQRRVLLTGLLIALALPVSAEEPSADAPKPPPLPLLELPPKPADPEGAPRARQANRLIQSGAYEAALPMFREAWEKGVHTSRSTYNAACAAAVSGEKDEAFVWLERTAAAGYRDLEHLEVDSDLDSLRDDPRFAAFLARVKANAERFDEENNGARVRGQGGRARRRTRPLARRRRVGPLAAPRRLPAALRHTVQVQQGRGVRAPGVGREHHRRGTRALERSHDRRVATPGRGHVMARSV